MKTQLVDYKITVPCPGLTMIADAQFFTANGPSSATGGLKDIFRI